MKKILAVILAIIMMLSFVACGGNEGDDGEQNNNSQNTISESPAKDFEYEEVNGGLKITKYLGNSEVVSIPSIINNKKVVEIKNEAFSGNVKLKEIIIPNTISFLDLYNFNNCDSLQKIVYLGCVDRVSGNSNSVKVPSLTTIEIASVSSRTLVRSFRTMALNSKTLENIVFKDVILEDDYYSGSYDPYLNVDVNNITLPESFVNQIGEFLAYKCYSFNYDDNFNKILGSNGSYFIRKSSAFDQSTKVEVPDSLKTKIQFRSPDGVALTEVNLYKTVHTGDGTTYELTIIGEFESQGKTYIYEMGLSKQTADDPFQDLEYVFSDGYDSFNYSENIYEQIDSKDNFAIFFNINKITVNGVVCELS